MGRLPHDRSHLLIRPGGSEAPTELFRKSITRWLIAHLSDDLASDEGSGDIVESMAYSKAGGVVCGKVPIDVLIEDFFPSCNINWFVEDGDRISIGDKILSLSGPSASVLSCERVLLNILGRLSGIATLTSEWVREADGIGVACTRKTSWGLLDKWAVHIGGGLTHRLSRSDALMIKENDLGVSSPESEPENSIPTAISSVNLEANAKFTVIEVQDASQAILAARAWSQSQKTRNGSEPIVILLDNMGPSACGRTGESLKSLGLREWCILEGSGGVKREDLPSWKAVSGVDVVSSSEVNMNSGTFDFSMLIGGV
ncbi:MAG: hypothetical protein VX909_05205 [Candidatus Thermoplasmatota archaeon]|nr:hypothetical protein [Candidatus Thermoplasmatota archaeon]